MENSMKNMLNWYVPGSQFFTSDYMIGSQAFNKELMTTLGQGAQKAAPIVSMFNPIVGMALGGAGKMQEQIGGSMEGAGALPTVVNNSGNFMLANGGVVDGYPYHYLSRMIAGETTNIYPDGNRMYSPKKELWQKAFNFNPVNPANPIILDNLTPSSIYGSSYNGNEISLPNLPNQSSIKHIIDIMGIIPYPVKNNQINQASNIGSSIYGNLGLMGIDTPPVIQPQKLDLGNPVLDFTKKDIDYNEKYAATYGIDPTPKNGPVGGSSISMMSPPNYLQWSQEANKMNMVGAGIGMAANALGIWNELNAKKSKDMNTPSMSDTVLDKDQSSFMNAMDAASMMTSNAQTQYAKQMGIDPGMMGTAMFVMNQNNKLKILAQADQTRQQLEAKEAEINANKKQFAAQAKMNADEFNMKKQIAENEMSSKNLMGSIMGIGTQLTAYGQAKYSNNMFADMMRNKWMDQF